MDGSKHETAQPETRRASRRGGPGPTLADVARVAGVSPMTVSRVINGAESVTVETRERVEAAIAMLNYVPNPAARSLAGRGQCRLALLYHNPSAAFLSEVLVGSIDQARQSDAQLLIEPLEPGEETRLLVQRLRHHRIDGVLVPAPWCDRREVIEELLRAGLLVARVAATDPMALGIAVSIDDVAAAEAMTRHLIARGHRRIGFVGGDPEHPVSALRLKGHRRALAGAGLAVDLALELPGDFTYRAGMAAAEALLALAERPTAIFASNDDMAAGAVAAAHRAGLDVPRDLSICGYDDTAMARSIWPELTTIRQPAAAMAARAVEHLAAQVRRVRAGGSGAAEAMLLAFEFVQRGSDGAPRG